MGETTRKKRVKFGCIEVEPQEISLIIKYEVEVVATTDGVQTVESHNSTQTKIRVKTLSADSNIEKLARQIAEKCKLIPASKVPLVVNKLYELQESVTGGAGAAVAVDPPPGPSAEDQDAERRALEQRAEQEEVDRQWRLEEEQRREDERRREEERRQSELRRQQQEDEAAAADMRRQEAHERERERERELATERERAAYNGFEEERGWGQPARTGDKGLGAWDEGDDMTSPGKESADSEADRALHINTERELAARKAERERREREEEERDARRQLEKQESHRELTRQKELQREWAEQREEEIELQREDELERQKEQKQMDKMQKQMDKVSFDKLDDYIEQLYEDGEKVKGTHKILLLARNPDHLEDLLSNETLLGVLSRLFREDTRKSMELIINIAYIFYSFSVYSKFHATISQQRVGDLTLRVVETEGERYQLCCKELEASEHDLKTCEGLGSAKEETLKKRIKKMRSMTRKQDKLLTVCFHILLNLAEDTKVEKKMKKRKIIPQLIRLLDRRNLELRHLAVMFLKKLSIFVENKDEMASKENNVVTKLARFVPCDHQPLLIAALRLLLNLSFDQALRAQMVDLELIQKLVEAFKRGRGPLAELALTLLYQLSTDPQVRPKFKYTECIPLVVGLLAQQTGGGADGDRTAVALAINLSLFPGNADQLSQKGQLRQLVRGAVRDQDNCTLKLIRNISAHKEIVARLEFRALMDDLLGCAVQVDNHDVLVEVLGTLANMDSDCCDLEDLVQKYNLLNWLKKFFVPSFVHDDIVLEVVMVVGVIASDGRCAVMIANSGLVQALAQMMEDQADDEIVLQLVYTLYCLVRHAETRDVILNELSTEDIPAHRNLVKIMIEILNVSASFMLLPTHLFRLENHLA